MKHTASMNLPHDTTFGQFKTLVGRADVPDEARMRVNHFAGDQREPAYTTIEFHWGSN